MKPGNDNNRPNRWQPLPGVNVLNFRGRFGSGPGGYYPPRWWKRGGKWLFAAGGVIGWMVLLAVIGAKQ